MTEVTGGELLTLWKVGRVELPKIAQVYLDAIDGLAAARGAAAAFFQPPAAGTPEPAAGQVGPAWQRVCDDLTETLSLCARNTLAGADAVGRAITEILTPMPTAPAPRRSRGKTCGAGSMIRVRSIPPIRTRTRLDNLPPAPRLMISASRARDSAGCRRNPATCPR
jgi:hypothetical protein